MGKIAAFERKRKAQVKYVGEIVRFINIRSYAVHNVTSVIETSAG